MRRPFSLTSRLFFMLVLAASLIGATGLKTYEYFSYKIERDKLSVRVATASVRISKALIKPAESADIEGVRHILSAFAASPEITAQTARTVKVSDRVFAQCCSFIEDINLLPVSLSD